MKANLEIRNALKEAKIPVWQVAYEIGVHENTVLRKLRIEMCDSEKANMLNIIKKLSKQKETA